jgi:CheY-like chemotaxis protein
MDGLSKVISSIAQLLWPVLGFYFLVRFGPKIFSFVSRLSEGSVKAFGVEASAKLTATDAIVRADLKSEAVAGDAISGTSFAPPRGTIAHLRRIASLITDAVSEEVAGKRVLWVDDRPEGNELEMIALTALRLEVKQVTTTEQAISDLRTRHFDVVISDMKRGDDEEAGYDLLGLMLALPHIPPLIFYSRSVIDQDIARRRGAFGTATKASDLVLLVKDALQVGKR